MIILKHDILEDILKTEYRRVRLCEASVHHVVEAQIQTSLRGVDSHGIALFPHYHNAIKHGRINGDPQMRIDRTNPSTAVLFADHALGHHSGSRAVSVAMEMAEDVGVGAVSVSDSTHFGAAAYFALQAAEHDHISFAFTNADSLVRAFNSKVKYFGTNPLCFAVPMNGEGPMCLDMSTTKTTWNKVRVAATSNQTLEDGVACDAEGNPTVDAKVADMLEPIGKYKGYGMAIMGEVLCSLLANGPAAREILPMFSAPIEARRHISHFFMVLRIDAFTDPENLKVRLANLASTVRSLEHTGEEVKVPGDPEKTTMAVRLESGIPIDDEVFQKLVDISPDFRKAVIG